MKDNFEFDKIVLAIAIGIITVLLSVGIGGFIYRSEQLPNKPGFVIEITDTSGGAEAPKGIPDVIDIGTIMAAANAENGQKIFSKCAVCHTIAKGEANKVGPNLWGIVGNKVTHKDDFQYSEGMKKHAAEKPKWGFEELYRYLYAPKTYVPGTKMAFAGVKKDQERADLIAYLRTMADSPLPLPAPSPVTSAPAAEEAPKK